MVHISEMHLQLEQYAKMSKINVYILNPVGFKHEGENASSIMGTVDH